MDNEKARWAKLAGLPEPINERFGEMKVMDRGDHLLVRGLYPSSPNTSVKITPTNGLTMDDVNNWRDELIQIAQQKSKDANIDWTAGILAGEDGKPTVGTPRGGTDEPYYIFSSGISGKGQQLDENFVGMGMVGNIFDREKEKYEDAFEHFLSERYEDKKVEENYTTEVRDAWPNLDMDERVDLLLAVYDDPDMAEKMAEREFDKLPEAAKQNMRMDMLKEEEFDRKIPLSNEYWSSEALEFSPAALLDAYKHAFEMGKTNPSIDLETALKMWYNS